MLGAKTFFEPFNAVGTFVGTLGKYWYRSVATTVGRRVHENPRRTVVSCILSSTDDTGEVSFSTLGVRVVAGSNPATPTNDKSCLFKELASGLRGDSHRPSGDCVQFCAHPILVAERDASPRTQFQCRNCITRCLNPDVSISSKHLVVHMTRELPDGLIGYCRIFGKTSYKGVARIIKAASYTALPLCGIKCGFVAPLTHWTI